MRNFIDRTFAFVDALPAGDRLFLRVAALVCAGATLWLVIAVNATLLVDTPGRGGALREGVVGSPRFINPVLAVTGADQDLAALVYASLIDRSADGTLVPEVAESVTVSDDGLVYSVTLRNDVTFHDGTALSADDVIFTVSRVQDQMLKSPHLASWDGVVVERLGDHELNFVLPEPYAPFIENLTLGILPKHIWEQANAEEFPFSQLNVEPVGAGPYRVADITRNRSGIPESYELVPYRGYFGEEPKVSSVTFRFYPTEDALISAFAHGQIDGAGGLSDAALESVLASGRVAQAIEVPLPRTFALFFNQNELPLLRDEAVRKALDMVIDREALVESVLAGHGSPITTPVPPGFGISLASTTPFENATLDRARDTLRSGGWRLSEESGMWEKGDGENATALTFSISTANTPVFGRTAEHLKQQWEALGVPVTIRQFEQSDLTQTVIRPRQFETLLFGTVVGRELDFFSFWHSSQRNDPGLNVALYANLATDSILTEARTTTDRTERATLVQQFSDELSREIPAIFLYVPTYTYVTAAPVEGISLTSIAHGSERWSTVSEWYIERESVWPFFTD